MTQVDFYLVGRHQRETFVCRLVEKAYGLGNDVFVHTPGEALARRIDDVLWTFRPGSFIPHEVCSAAGAPDACPVLVGFGVEPEGRRSVLINLHPQVPVFFSRFERVLEVLTDEDDEKRQARERYGFYRDRGYALDYHDLTA